MAWSLSGVYYENCSCDAICPCTWSNLAHRATQDYCRFAMAFKVASGEVDGIDLSGRTFAVIGDAPAQMDQGNWRLGLFVDDGASQEQVGKLGEVLSGERGGPPALLAPLVGEILGIEQAPISVEHDGDRHHVRVGDAVDYTGEQLTVEGGEPVTLTNILAHPAGPTMGIAPVTESTVSAFGIQYQGTDLSGFSNPFAWSG